jgi:predicted TIM-barrel fold metal-dependent hydrolase
VFSRHPDLRCASIEAGSEWVQPLLKKFKKAYSQNPYMFPSDPIQQFRDHVWVAPFYEDDIRNLADSIGTERVLFGSDYPHAEGLAVPVAFIDDLHGFTDQEVRLIMRDNARELIGA